MSANFLLLTRLFINSNTIGQKKARAKFLCPGSGKWLTGMSRALTKTKTRGNSMKLNCPIIIWIYLSD
ncbi:hypothetical protein C2869_15965 [Saccharobesus litoralis]|uniref:Uncharacterized protein n=1 Tax=Saccharobesus litoralis TaxID=2172099 RepID=A0A2S0VUD6_9ALTE|nr:hypothetical protein C2869_15965 [Saccharobesus litoralis]